MTMSRYPFRVGIVHSMAFPGILEGRSSVLETAKIIVEDDFFDTIEVSSNRDYLTRGELASLLKSSGTEVVFCGGGDLIRGNINLNALDPSTRRQAVEFVKQLADEAASLGAKTIVLCSGPDPGKDLRKAAMSVLASSLVEVADYVGKDIVVSLESFDRDVDKRRLVGPTREAVDLVLGVRKDCRNVGLTVDLSHLPLLKESPASSLAQARDVLVHTHIGSCLPDADSHPRFHAPNSCNGVPEVREFLRSLREIGYFNRPAPIVSFEVKPAAGETSESVIAESKEVLVEAMRGLI
jgi:sugar phosphate isomerase/epimerase